MIGYFVILSFDTKQDSAGAKVGANVKSQMDNNIDGFLYFWHRALKTFGIS